MPLRVLHVVTVGFGGLVACASLFVRVCLCLCMLVLGMLVCAPSARSYMFVLMSESCRLLAALLQYACKVLSKAADTSNFVRFCTSVDPLVCSHPSAARVVLNFFEDHFDLFRDTLLRNPAATVRAAFAGLFAKAIAYLADFESSEYETRVTIEVRMPACDQFGFDYFAVTGT